MSQSKGNKGGATSQMLNLLVECRRSGAPSETLSIKVLETSTVKSLKTLICSAKECSAASLKIRFQGKVINDERISLEAAGVKQMSQIVTECTLPLIGGGGGASQGKQSNNVEVSPHLMPPFNSYVARCD